MKRLPLGPRFRGGDSSNFIQAWERESTYFIGLPSTGFPGGRPLRAVVGIAGATVHEVMPFT